MTQHKCDKCDRTFNSAGGLVQHNNSKHYIEPKKPLITKKTKKKAMIYSVVILLIIGVIYLTTTISSSLSLPPTTGEGHSERTPPSHVLKVPMPIAVQKHMIEHSDGNGPPGIIINYDCETYVCSDDLISNLESFAGEYNNVYVAPFTNMKSKIVLTKRGRIQVLDDYDENTIRFFIGG